ncbi:hypothetical protein FA15DRAFT_683262 [Coprinopsis marcescibilis]|uniref:DUF6570 domain-containing protein n=1 Tax=Coprinopsis marcescibilis TaxID=230819 RepID=A0A5C3KFL9_COPMA|nr:hypothetical protein FA15DRAFT_683262 [Coprinopsis marcescibilis]
MISNVTSFANPTTKVYRLLPPSKRDIDDVIAIVFTGSTPPTEEDRARFPVLVRRMKILNALEWLKLNHSGYRDLVIDRKSLNKYGESEIPVEVLYHKTQVGDGNIPASSLSVLNTDNEQGTETGPCPFTVHGLTTSKFSNLSSNARKAIGLQHLSKDGAVLAVGQSEKPVGLFNNPLLYTQMYLWLFPYGMGSPGQMDGIFMVSAFNHLQIKASSNASFLMVKRGNFENIASSL